MEQEPNEMHGGHDPLDDHRQLDPLAPPPFGKAPRTGGVVVLFVLMMVGMILVGGICQYFFGFKINALVTEFGVILLPVIWVLRHRAPWKSLRLAVSPRPETLLTAVAGVLGLALILAEFTHWSDRIFPMPTSFKQAYLQAITADTPGELMVLILVAGLGPGLCEEIAFRGYFQQVLMQRYGWRRGIVWAAVLFATMHLDPWHLPALFIIGLYLGYLFVWTRSLWVPIVAHAANNAASVIMVYAMPDASLSQMSEPPPAWALILGFLLFGGAVWKLRRHRSARADESASPPSTPVADSQP